MGPLDESAIPEGENEEINKAISTLSQDNMMLKNTNTEEWIREAIAWLSQ